MGRGEARRGSPQERGWGPYRRDPTEPCHPFSTEIPEEPSAHVGFVGRARMCGDARHPWPVTRDRKFSGPARDDTGNFACLLDSAKKKNKKTCSKMGEKI